MRLELRPRFPGLVWYESEHRELPGLGVNGQLEAIRKQRLHH
jgi:hypothetical protein